MISEQFNIPQEVPTLHDVLNNISLISEALVCLEDHLLILRTDVTDQPINIDAFKELLDIIRLHCDYIIIDTPPVGLVSDALTLNPCVDGVLFVVKQDYANMGLVADSINMINDSGANLFGCILNGKKQFVAGRYYTKGQYYGDYSKKGAYYGRGDYNKRSRYYRGGYYSKKPPTEIEPESAEPSKPNDNTASKQSEIILKAIKESNNKKNEDKEN